MDERLDKALEFSNFMTTVNNQKRVLKEQYKESLIHWHQGGQFLITKELINFLSFLVSRDNINDVVITDDNDVPIMIKDIEDFLNDLLSKYFTAINKYHQNYSNLSKKRSLESFLNDE